MSTYRILSMDGGGIRGILTATLLERLEAAHPGFLKMFDLIAGTSTGGILTLGLAFGLTPAQASQMYENLGAKVFHDTLIDDVLDIGNFRGAEYSNKPLKEELERAFGNHTLGDLPTHVLVASFDLDNDPRDNITIRTWKPKFFHNYPSKDSDAAELMVDVGIRTSAAPTYFPIYQGYIDGGVIANNPSVCALAQALHPETGGQKIDDIVMLTLGTGRNPRHMTQMNSDWGLLQWAPHLVSLILEGAVGTAEYQCKQILGDRCLRINPILPVPIGLDNLAQIPLMKDIANQFDLTEAFAWVEKYFQTGQPPAVPAVGVGIIPQASEPAPEGGNGTENGSKK